MAATESNQRFFRASNALLLHIGNASSFRAYGAHPFPGIIELLAAFQAHLVGAFPDCEYAAFLQVMTAQKKGENLKRRFH